jgi:hypothetical protein
MPDILLGEMVIIDFCDPSMGNPMGQKYKGLSLQSASTGQLKTWLWLVLARVIVLETDVNFCCPFRLRPNYYKQRQMIGICHI